MNNAGFIDVSIELKELSEEYSGRWDSGLGLNEHVVSGAIRARKA